MLIQQSLYSVNKRNKQTLQEVLFTLRRFSDGIVNDKSSNKS